jgi:hypothetical protein
MSKFFDMMAFSSPSNKSWTHWEKQDPAILEEIASRIEEGNANPGVFAKGWSYFWEEATDVELNVIAKFGERQRAALLGAWAIYDGEA